MRRMTPLAFTLLCFLAAAALTVHGLRRLAASDAFSPGTSSAAVRPPSGP